MVTAFFALVLFIAAATLKGNVVQFVLLTLSGILTHFAVWVVWLPAAEDDADADDDDDLPVVTQGADVIEAALALDDAVRDGVTGPTHNAVRKQGVQRP